MFNFSKVSYQEYSDKIVPKMISESRSIRKSVDKFIRDKYPKMIKALDTSESEDNIVDVTNGSIKDIIILDWDVSKYNKNWRSLMNGSDIAYDKNLKPFYDAIREINKYITDILSKSDFIVHEDASSSHEGWISIRYKNKVDHKFSGNLNETIEEMNFDEIENTFDWNKNFYPCYVPIDPSTPDEVISEFQQWYIGYFMGQRNKEIDDKMIDDWYKQVRMNFNKIITPVGMTYSRREEYIPERYSKEVDALLQLGWDWRLNPAEPLYKKQNIESIINRSKQYIHEMSIINESIEFLNESIDNTKLRKSIENDIYRLLDEMDKSGENTKLYKERFSQLDDMSFFVLIDRLFSDPDFNLNIQFKPNQEGTNYYVFEEIARKLNVLIYDYMVMPYLIGEDGPDAPVSVEKVHFGVIKERRLHQTIRTKTGTSTSISHRNSETGQVIGEDKHSRVSDVDLYSLIGQSQMRAALEFHNERADDIVAQQNMLNQIRETGEYIMDKNDSSVLNKTSLLTMYYYMICAYLKNNIVEDSGLVLPATLQSRDIAQKIE